MIYITRPKDFNPKFEAVGCFFEYAQEILLLHRRDGGVEGNSLGHPGGKLNPGEDPLRGILREVREETGISLSPQRLSYLGKIFVRYPDFDFIYHMYFTRFDSKPEVKINYLEHKGFLWAIPKKALDLNLMQDEGDCIRLVFGL
jgi:8-oxo-dGTP pyrophosphatase MutT (NUDIX family)